MLYRYGKSQGACLLCFRAGDSLAWYWRQIGKPIGHRNMVYLEPIWRDLVA